MARPRSVLVADRPQAHPLLADVLAGGKLQFVQTLSGAKAALARGEFDAIVVGPRFDGGRLFQLVEHLRARPRYRALRVICVRTEPSLLPLALHGCVEQALRLLGISAYVILDAADMDGSSARLRSLVDGQRSPASAPDAAPDA